MEADRLMPARLRARTGLMGAPHTHQSAPRVSVRPACGPSETLCRPVSMESANGRTSDRQIVGGSRGPHYVAHVDDLGLDNADSRSFIDGGTPPCRNPPVLAGSLRAA